MKLSTGSPPSTRLRAKYWTTFAILIVFIAFCPQSVRSASTGTLSDEAAKQNSIYATRGERLPEGYVVDRSLLAYASFLSSGFDRSLAALGPSDRWLDIGAGRGYAVLDYYTERYDAMHPEGRERRGKKAQAVAISIEDRRDARWHEAAARLAPGQIRYLSGKRLREYSSDELGRFRLISDFTGGFSYTSQLSVFMEKVLALLEVNGDFYTMLLDVRPENHRKEDLPRDTQLLTEVEYGDGSDFGVCAWLRSIRCAQVTCEPDTQTDRPIELYHVHKVCEDTAVPALETRQFQAGTPPLRRFVARSGGIQTTRAATRKK